MVSNLNLTGNVSLNATPAINALTKTAERAEAVATNSRSATKTIKDMTTALNRGAAAAAKERDSLARLATAQAKVNALQKESLAQQKLIAARTNEVDARRADAQETAELKRLIAAEESDVKMKGLRAIATERLNNEQLRGIEIAQRADNAQNVAGGRVALYEAKAATEGVRQQTALRAQQDREDTNYTRRMQINSNMRIAQARLELAQRAASDRSLYQEQSLALKREAAANAARARAQTELRESLSVTRGALSSVGAGLTHFGTIGAAIFIGLAAEAMYMDRQFANVVRTSSILDESMSELHAQGFSSQQDAIDSLKLSFDALAQTLPLSYKELTEIGAAANQLGIKAGNLASFTKTVAQFSATTGVSVDTASTAFGRLDSLITDVYKSGKNLGGGVNHNFQELADSINKVGVKSVATDQQIINVASQIAGVSNAAGLGYKDIIGFSGALASVAVSPYLARGLTTRLFTNISNAVEDGGTQLQKYATISGLSAKQFKDAWSKSPREAITDLFDGIAASGDNAVNVLKSIGIKSVLDQPALIRLARAADSTGRAADIATRKGGILRQTFEDAYTAAGENAKQYAKIAETVQSRLTVALNRTQIAFRNLGEANLGPLSAIIDKLSTGMLRFSQNLENPVKLLGQFDLPFSVGDAAGFAVALTGIVSAVALIGGVGLKAAAGIIAVRQAFMGVSKFAGMASGGLFKFITGADESAAAAHRLAAADTELAGASDLAARSITILNSKTAGSLNSKGVGALAASSMAAGIAASQGLAAKAAKDSASVFNQAGSRMFSVYSGNVAKLQGSNNGLVRSFGNLASKGTGGMVRLSNSMNTVAGAAGRAGKAVGGFLGGPLGIILLVAGAVEGMTALSDRMTDMGSTAQDMSVGLSQANTQLEILGGTKVSGAVDGVAALWDTSTHKFMTSTKQFKASLDDLGDGGVFSDFAAKFRSLFADGKLNMGFNYTTAGLKKIDGGIKQLADNGDIDSATASLQTLFKGMTDAEVRKALNNMPSAFSVLDTKLNSVGKTAGKGGKNVRDLARNLIDLDSASLDAANQQQALTEAFGNNAAAATEYMEAVKKNADAAVDLNAIWSNVDTKSKNPFKDFIKDAKQSYQDFVDFQKNALIIANDTGASLADLSALDPHILAGAIKGTKKDEQDLADALDLKNAQAHYMTAVAKLSQTPKILGVFSSLGKKTQDAIAKGMSQGLDIATAFATTSQKAVDAYNKVVPKDQRIIYTPVLNVAAWAKQVDSLSHNQATALSVEILADEAPAVKKGEKAAKIISDMRATIMVDADGLAARRAGEEDTAYIDRLQGTISILGNTVPVQGKTESTLHYINRLKAALTIDGKNALAKQKADAAKKHADGTKGTIKIDGNNKDAKDKADAAKKYGDGKSATVKIKGNASGPGGFFGLMDNILHTGWSTVIDIFGKQHKAGGGPIHGPGTGTSDSIPAMLSNGEYVIRAAQAQKYRGLLDQINYGINGYATGGRVTGGSASYEGTSAAIASTVARSVNVSQYTELSPYDRHLLQTIANNIGVVIAPHYIANATTSTNRTQARRGNG